MMPEWLAFLSAAVSMMIALASTLVAFFSLRESRRALENIHALMAKGRELPLTPDISDPEGKEVPDAQEPDHE